jgi:hypothetical protein
LSVILGLTSGKKDIYKKNMFLEPPSFFSFGFCLQRESFLFVSHINQKLKMEGLMNKVFLFAPQFSFFMRTSIMEKYSVKINDKTQKKA